MSMTFTKAVSLDAEQVNERNAMDVIAALHGETLSVNEVKIRYARRILAVKKDIERKKDGKKAERFYRGDERAMPKEIRTKLGAVLERVDALREENEPVSRSVKTSKPAPHKAAPKAKSPTIRKVAAKSGGAAVSL